MSDYEIYESPVLESVLVISTSHMPTEEADFDCIRYVPHEYGYVLFLHEEVHLYLDEDHWLHDILVAIEDEDVSFLIFDKDGTEYSDLRTFDW